jgi:hypothetical protein
MRAIVYHSFEALPESYASLSADVSSARFTSSLAWYSNLVATTADDRSSLRLFGLESDAGAACALLVARRRRVPFFYPYSHCLEGWSNLYTPSFAPLVSARAGPPAAVAKAFAEAVAHAPRSWGSLRFDCWDRSSPLFGAFAEALRSQGFLIHSYFQFANLYEEVAGDTWETYLRRRSSKLRNLLVRKSRKLSLAGRHRFEVVGHCPSPDSAIEAYDKVYRASWKAPEPYPRFIPGLIKTTSRAGCLRLGLLFLDDEPIAAQLWLVSGGCATLYKLAHDKRHQALSPGSLLTAHMLRRVIEVEGACEVDFGRGGEAYKSLWMDQRRESWGLLAFDRRHPGALLEAARHLGAKRLRTLQRKLAGGSAGPDYECAP